MKPNYHVWGLLDEYTLEQSAWLWCDEEPRNGIKERSASVIAVMQHFQRAIDRGEIRARRECGVEYHDDRGLDIKRTIGVYSWPETYISRDELIKYAEQRHETPPFLFLKTETPDSIQARREKDLEELIAELEQAAAKKGEPFDRMSMPHTKEEIRSMLTKRDRALWLRAEGAFEKFWKAKSPGICGVRQGRPPSPMS